MCPDDAVNCFGHPTSLFIASVSLQLVKNCGHSAAIASGMLELSLPPTFYGHVDVLKFKNYNKIRSCLYRLSFNELAEAGNSFPEKITYFDEVRLPNFWEIYSMLKIIC